MSGDGSKQERASGVLLHVTSLPSYGGIGDFGGGCRGSDCVGKQRLWQVLRSARRLRQLSPYSSAFGVLRAILTDQPGTSRAERPDRMEPHRRAARTRWPRRRQKRHRWKLPLIEEAKISSTTHRTTSRPASVLQGQHLMAARLRDVQRAAAAVQLRKLEQVARRVRTTQT